MSLIHRRRFPCRIARGPRGFSTATLKPDVRLATARTCGLAPSVRAQTTRPSWTTWASPRSTLGMAAKARPVASIIRFTIRLITTLDLAIRTLLMVSPSPRPVDAPRYALPMLRCCRMHSANFADSVGNYVREVGKLADDLREETKEKNRRIADKTFTAYFDPTETYVLPKPDGPVPFLNFAPLQNAFVRLQESAQKYDAAARVTERKMTPQKQQAIDLALMQTERAMIRDAGLPRRPWFKHQIYAPGFYTGYGVKTLPAIREAIEQRNWPEAEQQINLVAETINQIAAAIDRATAVQNRER